MQDWQKHITAAAARRFELCARLAKAGMGVSDGVCVHLHDTINSLPRNMQAVSSTVTLQCCCRSSVT